MAKDILVDTNSSDFLSKSWDKKVEYRDTVWGKLFDKDKDLYLNVIIPYHKVNQVRYDDNGEYICKIHADYYGDASTFLVRFVTKDQITGKYIDLRYKNTNCPNPCECEYRQEFMDMPKAIFASQLQVVEQNGYFQIQFKRYKSSNIERVFIYQAEDIDFEIGQGDDQSAQLLARCAPGKYYRYPTSGVDLTKYIGSVVEHSDITDRLSNEFDRDNKSISEASFDNESGDLKILFTGANEATDKELDDPSTLDVELLKVADDDYVRALYKAAQGLVMDNEGFRSDILDWTGKIIGMWDVGGECELDKLAYTLPNVRKRITDAGLIDDKNTGYIVGKWENVKPGILYALEYKGHIPPLVSDQEIINDGVKRPIWRHDAFFMAETSDGEKYIDNNYRFLAYSGRSELDCKNYYNNINRKLFMALKECSVYCYIGSQNTDGTTAEDLYTQYGCGLRVVTDKRGNYASILTLAVHPTTGKLYGIVSLDSEIEEVRIEKDTNRLLVIKQSKS